MLDKLTDWACELDRFLRRRDFAIGRTAGGYLDRHFGIRRHTVAALLWPAALVFFAVMATPNLPRFVWAAVTGAIVFLVLTKGLARNSRNKASLRSDLVLELAVVSAVIIAMALFAPRQYNDFFPYKNLLLPLVLIAAAALFVGMFLSDALFKRLRHGTNFAASLRRTELFANEGTLLPVTPGGLLLALALVPFRAPLELLLPPAIVALLARPEWLTTSVLITFALSVVALVLSGLNVRFGMMWSVFTYPLLHGPSLLVSMVVIALALARFFGVTYVTTVFDTAEVIVIFNVLLSIYVLAWWLSYWSNRLLLDQFIRIIDPASQSGEVALPYQIEHAAVRTHVPEDGRMLQVHGSSRLVTIREATNANEITYFQAYPALDLLNYVAFSGAAGGRAVPTFLQLNGRAFTFNALLTVLMAILLAVGARVINQGKQDAELLTSLDASGGVSLASLLKKPGDDHTLFVVAASGGGTRAALFTTAILEGFASRGKLADVVLASGISGGGAALAYFTGFRSSLVGYDRAAWKQYYEAMKAPYIRDVLDRATEWRMVREGRLGMLLRESFHDHWKLGDEQGRLDSCGRDSFGAGCDFGLILNSTLAGSLHLPKPADKPLEDAEPAHRGETTSSVAGGRIIYTNLALPTGFAGRAVEPDDPKLPVVIRGPGTQLEHAAALNANFPPVFANAAVDVDRQDRYWVTDGGAADNRGIEMLLYALASQLSRMKAEDLPKLHLVVADAGGYSDDYVQDRGVSSALGAGAHFASALDSQLKSFIDILYTEHPDRFHFSYVYMPRPLRQSGSFGTHWMLQGRITVHKKSEHTTFVDWLRSWIGTDENKEITISGDEMVDVLRSLYNRAPLAFDAGKPLALNAKACNIQLWSYEETSPEQSRAKWKEVMAALGDTAADPPAVCK